MYALDRGIECPGFETAVPQRTRGAGYTQVPSMGPSAVSLRDSTATECEGENMYQNNTIVFDFETVVTKDRTGKLSQDFKVVSMDFS